MCSWSCPVLSQRSPAPVTSTITFSSSFATRSLKEKADVVEHPEGIRPRRPTRLRAPRRDRGALRLVVRRHRLTFSEPRRVRTGSALPLIVSIRTGKASDTGRGVVSDRHGINLSRPVEATVDRSVVSGRMPIRGLRVSPKGGGVWAIPPLSAWRERCLRSWAGFSIPASEAGQPRKLVHCRVEEFGEQRIGMAGRDTMRPGLATESPTG